MADRTLPPDIFNQQVGAGDMGALNQLRSKTAETTAQTTGRFDASAYQNFLTQLTGMLKDSQSLGTKPLQERGLDLQSEQAGRILQEATPGFSPSQQSSIRSASASALEPSITGTAQRAKTFSEQLSGFSDTLSQSRLLASSLYQIEQDRINQERQQQQDLRDTLWKFPDAFKSLNPEEQAKYEKEMGLPKGYIASIPKVKADREVVNNQIWEKDPTTGQWKMVASAKETTDPSLILGDYIQEAVNNNESPEAISLGAAQILESNGIQVSKEDIAKFRAKAQELKTAKETTPKQQTITKPLPEVKIGGKTVQEITNQPIKPTTTPRPSGAFVPNQQPSPLTVASDSFYSNLFGF